MPRRPKLGVRARLLIAVVAAVAIALAALVAAFNVVLSQRLSANATDLARVRANARLSALRVVDGRVLPGEGPDDAAVDSQVWIFANGRAIEQPQTSPASVAAAARALAVSGARTIDVAGADTRLSSVPIVSGGQRLGSVVAGVSLAPYEETRKLTLLGSIGLGVALLLAVALAARWLLAAALRPVAQMTADAAAWSERDADRRFAPGEPYDELTRLAATLDNLLDRLAASLRHEQRFTAELSHELRTPLAKISAESELALRRARPESEYRAALEVVKRNADDMTRTVETLVAAARHEAGFARSTADARTVAAAAAEACSSRDGGHDVEVVVDLPRAPLRVGVDEDFAARILQPILENAYNYSQSRVRLALSRDGATVLFTVDDDGPGVTADERDRIFEPGVRGQAALNGRARSGAGLGLSLSRRLARAAGGDVTLGTPKRGARFLIRLPAA
jgi:signal transduction histidine kinase